MPLPDGMHKDVVIVADNIAWRRWCSDFSDHDLASVIMSTAAICDGSFDPVVAYGEPAIKLDRLDLEAMTRMAHMALELAEDSGWDPSSGETVTAYYDRMEANQQEG